MSLPDTVFIFVLALIIFGPKKLPEIGRQLGKLVGEFRRASNEFKFQIEEELRQAELSDRNTIAPAKKELETSVSAEASTEPPNSSGPDLPYPEETLPVGQYPNIDSVKPQDLTPLDSTELEDAPVYTPEKPVTEDSAEEPVVNPAAGSEPRTTSPYAVPSTLETDLPTDHTASGSSAASLSNHDPATPYAAPAVADVTHG